MSSTPSVRSSSAIAASWTSWDDELPLRTLAWTYEDAEAYLASLEPVGWRFGLDRIRTLVSVLGMPQHRFASVHVVGTNGKSSVAEMTEALIRAHGVSAGAYLSPHEERWSERIRIGGAEIGADAFASAVERVAASAASVNRTLGEGEAVTQFEVLTAAAFVSFAAARVEVAVIEAGLGGRLDATNVLPSRVTALTSIGLDHTDLLGHTEEEIAQEKLAVLRDHSTLVLGPVGEAVEALARRAAASRHARLIPVRGLTPQLRVAGAGAYQRRNFAVALACADAVLGALEPERVAEVAASLVLHGRMEVLEGDPPLVLDAAHNPAAARALGDAVREVAGGRPVFACMAVLADKDAEGILRSLADALAGLVATEVPVDRLERIGRPGARSLTADRLAAAGRGAGMEATEAVRDPGEAVERAQEIARERDGVVLVCGSHYLLRYASRD
jgi:dihydrofolate synthase / folylpolyglutamate synthase